MNKRWYDRRIRKMLRDAPPSSGREALLIVGIFLLLVAVWLLSR